MDQRVYEVMQKLRKQVLSPPPGNAHPITRKISHQAGQKISLEEIALQVNLSES